MHRRDGASFAFVHIMRKAIRWRGLVISAEMVMYIAFPIVAIIGARSAPLLLGIGLTSLTVMMTVVASRRRWNLLGSSGLNCRQSCGPCHRSSLAQPFSTIAALFLGFLRQASSLAVATACLIVAMMSGVSQLITLLLVYTVAIAAVAADLEGVPSATVQRFAPLGQLTYSIYMWAFAIHLIFTECNRRQIPARKRVVHGHTCSYLLHLYIHNKLFVVLLYQRRRGVG